MDLDIGAKNSINGDHVFLVGQCFSSSEPPFVLLYDQRKRRRLRRNILKIEPAKVVATIGIENFVKFEYPKWGHVWFRSSKIRGVRELSTDELITSPAEFGSLVLFEHDPEPEDQHAGFLLFGIDAKQASRLLGQATGE